MKQRLSALALAAEVNRRILLVRWIVYGLLLLVVASLPRIYFTTRSLWVWLVVAAGFGILNAIVRPLLQALMLQLFFASMGLVVALINAFLLYLLSWIFPNAFAVDSILWALVGGVLMALFGSLLEGLFGLTRPIVPESEAELSQRLKAQDRSLVYTFIRARPVPVAGQDALPQLPGPAPNVAPPQGAVEAVEQAATELEKAAIAASAAQEVQP